MNNGIRGGWRIQSLPDEFHSPALQYTWENKQRRQLDTPTAAVHEMRAFLATNGYKITDQDIAVIRNHARLQYCTAEPSRCKGNRTAFKQVTGKSDAPDLPFARNLWQTINAALATDTEVPVYLSVQLAALASHLIHGKDGCEKCGEHWEEILSHTPPSESIKSMDDARIWWWSVHNATREGKGETPYLVVARSWKWPELSAEAIMEAVTRMGLDTLP